MTKSKAPEQEKATEEKKKPVAKKATVKKVEAKPDEKQSIPPVIKEEKPKDPKKPKHLTGEEAYHLLNEGKKLRHPNVPTGYIQRVDGNFRNFANNGDYLGNVVFADLQDVKGWEENK